MIETNQTDGSREWPFIPLDPFCVCSSKIILNDCDDDYCDADNGSSEIVVMMTVRMMIADLKLL